MKKINVNYLPHSRIKFFELTVNVLKKIKEDNKKDLHITISSDVSSDINFWNTQKNELINSGIECDLVLYNPGFNYMAKINNSVNKDSKYTLKFDEDIFMNNYLWDYIIENCDILEDDENLLLAPLLSSGIPTVDLFVEDFFDENDKNTMKNCFKNTIMPREWWGCFYEQLNNYTIRSNEWNSDKFYEGVNKINHYYKGIHPVRANSNANVLINDLIWKDLSKIVNQKYFYIDKYKKYPYLCNSCFLMKTDTYRKIVFDNSLFRDAFDEVPINLYKQNNNLNFCFIRNGFGIHYFYNSVPNYIGLEKTYYNRLKQYIG